MRGLVRASDCHCGVAPLQVGAIGRVSNNVLDARLSPVASCDDGGGVVARRIEGAYERSFKVLMSRIRKVNEDAEFALSQQVRVDADGDSVRVWIYKRLDMHGDSVIYET